MAGVEHQTASNADQQKAMDAFPTVMTGVGIAAALVGSKGGKGETLADDALVVRGGSGQPGGANSVEGIMKGTGTHSEGPTGFSAESANGKTMEQLIKESPEVSTRGQVGCCTVGQVCAEGGDVIPTSGHSPNMQPLPAFRQKRRTSS